MRRLLSLFFTLHISLFAHHISAIGVGGSGMFQYSVELTNYISNETGKAPVAYLWIPEGCKQLRAVILCQQNMTEEAIMKWPSFRRQMTRLGVGMIWVAPAFSNNWSPTSAAQTIFENLMTGLAGQSGHSELETLPVIPIGHSAQATFPWNFAAWNPERTLCILSFHGDAPRTNLCGYGTDNVEWGRTRNIDGIPGLMVEGEYEWWEARVRPALAFRMMYPESCISFLCDTGRGHFDCSESTALYMAKFIEKAMQMRLSKEGKLQKVNPQDGYLFSRFHNDMIGTDGADKGKMPEYYGDYVPPISYKDNEKLRKGAEGLFWYPDKEMAQLTYDRYRQTQGKQPLTFTQKMAPTYEADSLTLHISLPTPPADYKGKLHTEVICGALKLVNDTTLRVYPYECGWDNNRRSFSAWVVVVAEPDKKYKGGVLPFEIRLPHCITKVK